MERARAVQTLLHDRRSTFVVVTTLEGAPLREAEFFCSALRERDFHLGAMVLNRTLPDALRAEQGRRSAATILADPRPAAEALGRLGIDALADEPATTRVLCTAAETFRDYSTVASREAELRAELAHLPDVVVTVPALEDDVHDVAGLATIGDRLFDLS